MPDAAQFVRQARDVADETVMLARLTRDLPGWLGTPFALDVAEDRLRQGLIGRDERFLRIAERAIYGYPRSPYLTLLRLAGCEPGDLRRLVQQDGLEGALKTLAGQGVYVTFDELKGRREAVRGSARFKFSEEDFDSPLLAPHWVVFTGGTGGRPGRVLRALPLVEEIAVNAGATLAAHGLADARHVFWLTNPIAQMLVYTKLGQQTIRWLQPLDQLPTRARLGAGYFAGVARLLGRRLPMPRYVDVKMAGRLAAWLDRRPRDGRPLVLNTMPSAAVRVAVAAREAGIDLTGVTFHLQSEPVTEARRNHLTATGARVLVNYGSIETPGIAYGCAASTVADDLHVFEERFALIERERLVTEIGPSVNAMLVTTLTENAGKICLNVEPGDYGQIERRACGCRMGALGLTLHLSEVRSFEKLSGEGVSFARSSLLQVLEEALPAQFGGSAVDYQIVEEEGSDSATRIVLRVSPSVGAVDEQALRAALLAELGRGGVVDQSHASLLRLAGSVVISRQPPLATGAGKVLPFHLLRVRR